MQITCPSCGQTLNISDAAPSQLTCPKCLAKLINPGAMTGGAARAVIPVEVEASRDTGAAKLGIIGLIALLAFAAVIGIGRGGTRAMAEPALHVVILAIIGTVIWVGARKVMSGKTATEVVDAPAAPMPATREAPPAQRDPRTPPPLPALPSGILDYQDREQFRQQRFSVGAFIGGFFAALGVCAAGLLSFAVTYDAVPKPMHPLVALAVIGGGVGGFIFFSATIAKRRPSWRGFGRGATIGLVLGMLALGPCALCYIAI